MKKQKKSEKLEIEANPEANPFTPIVEKMYITIGNDQSVITPFDDTQAFVTSASDPEATSPNKWYPANIVARYGEKIPVKALYGNELYKNVYANIYRPVGKDDLGRKIKVPLIISVTDYNKDVGPDGYLWTGRGPKFRSVGTNLGDLTVSSEANFEAADPAYWLKYGYAVAILDSPSPHANNKTTKEIVEEIAEDRYTGPFSLDVVSALGQAIIELANEDWCNGHVGLQGVSYLGIMQWHIARWFADNAESGSLSNDDASLFKAINVWEGLSDYEHNVAYHGAIPETSFIYDWLGMKNRSGGHGFLPFGTPVKFGVEPYEDELTMTNHRPDYEFENFDLKQIKVPVLNVATWSNQGLHSRGNFMAHRILSNEGSKVYDNNLGLYFHTHGLEEWSTSSSDAARDIQRGFFNQYLMPKTPTIDPDGYWTAAPPKVSIDVLKGYNEETKKLEYWTLNDDNADEAFGSTGVELAWPLRGVEGTPFYLDGTNQYDDDPTICMLQKYTPIKQDVHKEYVSNNVNDEIKFRFDFENTQQIIGHPVLTLYAQIPLEQDEPYMYNSKWEYSEKHEDGTDPGDGRYLEDRAHTRQPVDDMDIFVALRKIDAQGNVVRFWNQLALADIFTRGWIRAGYRELDEKSSYPDFPVLDYTVRQALDQGTIYELQIELLPIAVQFEPGETLELIIKGSSVIEEPQFRHLELVNVGKHRIYTSGSSESDKRSHYNSCLRLPIVRLSEPGGTSV